MLVNFIRNSAKKSKMNDWAVWAFKSFTYLKDVVDKQLLNKDILNFNFTVYKKSSSFSLNI